MNRTQNSPKRRQEKQLSARRKHWNDMQVTDRPSPDAASLTQAIIVQMVYCELHLRARLLTSSHALITLGDAYKSMAQYGRLDDHLHYLVALPTNPPECSHGVWSRNGREGCSGMLYDVITQMVHSYICCFLSAQRCRPCHRQVVASNQSRSRPLTVSSHTRWRSSANPAQAERLTSPALLITGPFEATWKAEQFAHNPNRHGHKVQGTYKF